jgi:xanthine dehydrogenase accessory factor
MMSSELTARVTRLSSDRAPYVLATVVGARRPTSVRPGDRALVLGDGTIEGFVGGVCASSSVRLHALRTLETGEPLLLRLVPDDAAPGVDVVEGAVIEHNPCLSGGTLEIFLEPCVPPPRVVVIGDAPIARALEQVAAAAGYDAERGLAGEVGAARGDAAVIVASHGASEEQAISEALAHGVPYVALVASAVRGEAIRASLDVPDELRSQLRTPAGLSIGARSPGEIAISIVAELVACLHAQPRPALVATDESVDHACCEHHAAK